MLADDVGLQLNWSMYKVTVKRATIVTLQVNVSIAGLWNLFWVSLKQTFRLINKKALMEKKIVASWQKGYDTSIVFKHQNTIM